MREGGGETGKEREEKKEGESSGQSWEVDEEGMGVREGGASIHIADVLWNSALIH